VIYLNGKFISPSEFKIEPNDRGLLLGDGLFETMRVYNGNTFCLEEHYNRLVSSAALLEIPVLINLEELNAIILKLLEVNNLSQKDATLRLTLTMGPAPRGLLPPDNPKPMIMIAAFPLLSSSYAPVRLYICNKTRRNDFSPFSNTKILSYVDGIYAKKDAVKNNADDAILLNTKGNIACVSAGNIFIVTHDGKVLTPRKEDGILPGIARMSVLEICKENGIEAIQKTITTEDLSVAKEVFITNSIIEVQSVVSINNQLINKGEVGEVTSKIQDCYNQKAKKKYQLSVKEVDGNYKNPLLLINNFNNAVGGSNENLSPQLMATGVVTEYKP